MEDAPLWLINGVGVAAALCSMASFVPQIIKIAREKDASGVSLGMFSVTVVGFIAWSVYGVLSGSWPVAVSNMLNVGLAGAVLALRLRYGPGQSGGAQRA